MKKKIVKKKASSKRVTVKTPSLRAKERRLIEEEQRQARRIIATARSEASGIVDHARELARGIENQARWNAKDIISEAQQRAKNDLRDAFAHDMPNAIRAICALGKWIQEKSVPAAAEEVASNIVAFNGSRAG